jgi:hypothetical protein
LATLWQTGAGIRVYVISDPTIQGSGLSYSQ